MDCLQRFPFTHFSLSPTSHLPPHPSCSVAAANNRFGRRLRAKVNGEHDPFLQTASDNATLRYLETHRPEPLFVDPYVGCLVNLDEKIDDDRDWIHHHCLATKFIDDRLMSATKYVDGPKQVVLLTDGMDTRPYRLSWPSSTLIFDISPGKVYEETSRKLKEVGARIPRSCFLTHIPRESSDVQQDLYKKGFNGSRPSIWAVQGFSLMTVASMEDVLFNVSSLAMKGSILVGELPARFGGTEISMDSSRDGWVDKLFLSHGFRVNVIPYEEIARSLGQELPFGDPDSIIFSGENLRLSDAQMEIWRSEFQRVEEEGDEDGFEEL